MCCTSACRGSSSEAKLLTSHICIIYIPCIIANCSPEPTVKHFNTTVARSTIRQTNWKRVMRTSYTGILTMSAVFMVTPTIVSTTGNWRLISKAIQRIYPYWTGSLAMTGAAKDLGNPVEAKLLTGHSASVDVPPIVTNCAPVIIKKDLYPSSVWIITSYTQCTICQNFERKEDSISTDLWFDWNVHQLFNCSI